ncbi:hypothetical protein K501DRAFT_289043 [Backusella circina FSU 941]|nr:hypothetical protein K501DRAFT_289043 [Backusella circina FSU 941]
MSDFGDFNTPSDDPTSDFLARERAVLGDDADLFTDDNNNNLLGGDVVSPSFNNDHLTSVSNMDSPALHGENLSPSIFNSPSVNESQAVVPAESSYFDEQYPKAEDLDSSKALHKAMMPEEEPETVRLWREKQEETIKKRDQDAEQKKQDTIQRAREDIDKFYEEYNDKKQKIIEENRAREETRIKQRDDVNSSANIWERVASEVDTSNAKSGFHAQDVTRMKDLIVDLKRDKAAPGNIVDA